MTGSTAEKSGTGLASKGEPGGFGSVVASTEQLCRTLKAYRQRLEKSSAMVETEKLGELENELETTLNLVQRTLKGRRCSVVELDKDLDKLSIASTSSWTEIEATCGGQVQDEDEATPRRIRVTKAESERRSGCESSEDVSFVSAQSQPRS
jgi:hypothetical protein